MSRRHTADGATWIYRGIWSGVVRWFRVPGEPPALPSAAGETNETFHPAPGFLRYLRLVFWIVVVLAAAALIVLFVVITAALWTQDLAWVALLLAPIFLVLLLVPAAIGLVAIHLRFDCTYYVITDRSLRIRRGVWIIHETTISFENVQNLRISRGPLQQLFGIADLVVETAGAGGDSEKRKLGLLTNQGIIQGVDHAEALRDRILPHLRRTSRAGLGDEEESRAAPAWSAEHLRVLREIRDLVEPA